MKQEEKQLLLKDLSARLSYGVICNTPKGDGHLCSINQTIFGTEYGVNIKATKRDYFNDREICIKPYLRPMYSMTEEEKKEFYKVVCDSMNIDNISPSVYVGEWQYSKHFDVHGLIEKGLALEAPEGVYNIKEYNKI